MQIRWESEFQILSQAQYEFPHLQDGIQEYVNSSMYSNGNVYSKYNNGAKEA